MMTTHSPIKVRSFSVVGVLLARKRQLRIEPLDPAERIQVAVRHPHGARTDGEAEHEHDRPAGRVHEGLRNGSGSGRAVGTRAGFRQVGVV